MIESILVERMIVESVTLLPITVESLIWEFVSLVLMIVEL